MKTHGLRVVQLLPELDAGGVGQGAIEVGRALVQQGHLSTVISRGGQLVQQLESEGSRHITMKRIGDKSPRALVHLGTLRQFLKEHQINILHLRSRVPAWIGFWVRNSLPNGSNLES